MSGPWFLPFPNVRPKTDSCTPHSLFYPETLGKQCMYISFSIKSQLVNCFPYFWNGQRTTYSEFHVVRVTQNRYFQRNPMYQTLYFLLPLSMSLYKFTAFKLSISVFCKTTFSKYCTKNIHFCHPCRCTEGDAGSIINRR